MLASSMLANHRREDARPGEASPADDAALPRIAFDWLQNVLHAAFADAAPPPPSPPDAEEPD